MDIRFWSELGVFLLADMVTEGRNLAFKLASFAGPVEDRGLRSGRHGSSAWLMKLITTEIAVGVESETGESDTGRGAK